MTSTRPASKSSVRDTNPSAISAGTGPSVLFRYPNDHKATWLGPKHWLGVLLAPLIIAGAFLGLWTSPADAHTGILDSSPLPDSTVGGTVDSINLLFSDPITDAVITVSYNQEPLAGATTKNAGTDIVFELDSPLAQPGRYQVTVDMISYDGDVTKHTIFFTYDPAAPPPGSPTSDSAAVAETSSGPNPVLSGLGALVLVGILGAVAWKVSSGKQQKSVV